MDPSPEEIDRELLYQIGRIARVWTHIEMQSWILLRDVSGVGEDACRRLTAGMPLAGVWDATESFMRGPKAVQGESAWFKEWRVGAAELQGQRNMAIHSAWGLKDGTSPVASDLTSRRARDGFRHDLFPNGSIDLENLFYRIDDCALDLRDFVVKRTWPGIEPPPRTRPRPGN